MQDVEDDVHDNNDDAHITTLPITVPTTTTSAKCQS